MRTKIFWEINLRLLLVLILMYTFSSDKIGIQAIIMETIYQTLTIVGPIYLILWSIKPLLVNTWLTYDEEMDIEEEEEELIKIKNKENKANKKENKNKTLWQKIKSIKWYEYA